MSIKIKILMAMVLATLLLIPYYTTTDRTHLKEEALRTKSAEASREIAEISASFVFHLDMKQLKTSLMTVLRKKPFVHGIVIEDALTGESLFSYFRSPEGVHYNQPLPESITTLVSSRSDISFENHFLGKVTVYCKAMQGLDSPSESDSDLIYKLRFLIALAVLLSLTAYIAYQTLSSTLDSDENPLAFGTKKFAVFISIAITLFIALSIAGGWIVVDQSERNIKKRVKDSILHSLDAIEKNITLVSEIRSNVHHHITQKTEFQEILTALILARANGNTEAFRKSQTRALLFLKKYKLFAGTKSRIIVDRKGHILLSNAEKFTTQDIDTSPGSPFSLAAAGHISLYFPPVSDPKATYRNFFLLQPVYDKYRRVVAITYEEMNKNNTSIFTALSLYNFSATGEVLMVNRNGRILSQTRFASAGDDRISPDTENLKTVIDNAIPFGETLQEGKFLRMTDYRGREVFAVVKWNNRYSVGFVAKIDKAEILENFYQFRRGVYLVIGMMSFFSVYFTIFTFIVGKNANQTVLNSRHGIISRLGNAAEFKDNDTARHIARISLYSEVLAEKLPTTQSWRTRLYHASPMHDIGKIGIPDSILSKPGKLDPEEWTIMRQHPEFGAKIIGESDSSLLQMAKDIALYHHEKWDGSGYPTGIAGEEIPLSARIVAVADVFDALTCERVYKKAWPVEKAIALIQSEAGKHFDPGVVAAFMESIPAFKEIRDHHADR